MAADVKPIAARRSLAETRFRARTPRWHGVVEWGIRFTAFTAAR
jgi:hypothetical protein